jgi:hypothetical protein
MRTRVSSPSGAFGGEFVGAQHHLSGTQGENMRRMARMRRGVVRRETGYFRDTNANLGALPAGQCSL